MGSRGGERLSTTMKLSMASLGGEPSARYLDQLKLAELLGFHAFFHNDKKWARDAFARLGAATQCTTRLGLGFWLRRNRFGLRLGRDRAGHGGNR